jgi:hypothetical protein
MKKQTHPIQNCINFIFILVVFLALTCAGVKALIEVKSQNKITHSITDERGLTSVIYVQDGQERALDYLTPQELDSLKIELEKQ